MSDGVQAYGKLPVKLHSTSVDLYTISGHKVHAPKGIGALYVKKESKSHLFLGRRSGKKFKVRH